MGIQRHHIFLRALSSGALAFSAVSAPTPALPTVRRLPAPDPQALAAIPDLTTRARLLAPGRTQGAFHLNGVVDAHGTVILRWANDQGEMPTEGVVVSRQKVDDSSWKDLNPKEPVAFFKTSGLQSRFDKLPGSKQELMLSMFYSDVARDPATGRRAILPQSAPKGAPQKASELKFKEVANQFKSLRSAGKLAASDLMLLNTRADLDPDTADAFGLVYRDRPPSGSWRYRITVKLPEGGTVQAVCPKSFDRSVPTPIPPCQAPSASSANGAVLLNWQAAAGDTVAGYNLYRAPSAKGPYQKLNASPVKLVTLTAADPSLTLQTALAQGSVITRDMRQVPAAQATPAKVAQVRAEAADATSGTALPPLSAAQAHSIQTAVAAGRLAAAGPVRTLSAYTDSITSPGNTGLVNEHTYYYKIASVDLAGREAALDGLAPVPGTPRDLQPPQVPGRPGLAPVVQARLNLGAAQARRLQDPRLLELDQAVADKSPVLAKPAQPVLPLLTHPAPPPAPKAAVTVRPAVASLSLARAKGLELSRIAATMPVKEMAAVGTAQILTSLPDGSAPPANLVWTPSPDADLKLYTIYRATNNGPMARVGTSAAASWSDPSLAVGSAYTYAVSATDQVGNESLQSPTCVVQVTDRSLPGRLAISGLQGKAAPGPAPVTPAWLFLRPDNRVMTYAGLDSIGSQKATVKLPAPRTSPVVAVYAEPKAPVRAAPHAELLKGLARPAAPAAGKAMPIKTVDPGGLKATVHLTAIRPLPARSWNPMLVPPPKPTVISVQLTWSRPLQGVPLTYSVFEAPQSTKVASAPRTPVRKVTALLGPAQANAGFKPGEKTKVEQAKVVAPTQPSKTADPVLKPGMIHTTPEIHAAAASNSIPGAVALAANREDQLASLLALTGPGTFSLITASPIATETYWVTFPAEAAQYGGATFYFQVQAHTQEFGRQVDGPVSQPVAVTLPDIVPPPVPVPGSVDLQAGSAGSINVALAWTQTVVPDLAGTLVLRQPMAYQVVDGIAQPGAPAGPAQTLTPSPAPGLAYTDPSVPGGYYRYTLSSADHTGNASATQGYLDILVPGEPPPDAPQGVVLSGGRISWQAARNAGGYTVWRSYTGVDVDYDCISPILGAGSTGYDLPAAQSKGYLRVVSRSPSGMYQAPSEPVVQP